MILSELEQKILTNLETAANNAGFNIVKIRLHGGNMPILEIAIDKIDGSPVGIKDCRTLSNDFSAILDVEDLIPYKYNLEVSSAGVERPLVKLEDFEKFKGKEIAIKLHQSVDERKKWQGKLLGVQQEQVALELSDNQVQTFQYDNIKSANIVFTEEMFRAMLNKTQ